MLSFIARRLLATLPVLVVVAIAEIGRAHV